MIVLIPIAGNHPHFPPEEFAYPRPLIEIAGRPMIAWVLDNLKSLGPNVRFVFVALEDEAISFSFEKIFNLLTQDKASLISLKHKTDGALCSCLLAIDQISPEEPLVIANSDQIIDSDLSEIVDRFVEQNADAGVITFNSVHPRWSYVSLDDEGMVVQSSEKQVISRNAIAGFYYFRRAEQFFESAKLTITHNVTKNGLYYISSCLNEMILQGKRVAAIEIAAEKYFSFYHPKQLASVERLGAETLKAIADRNRKVSVVIPAAGLGSRFAKAGFALPKPFIDVQGRPMIARVIDNLALDNAAYTLLFQNEHCEDNSQIVQDLHDAGHNVVRVKGLTEGTACTVLHARKYIDNELPLLIANSDQIVDLPINRFINDCLDRKLDGSILVFRDETRNPKWSFARLDDNGQVVEVAEKRPISDLATVGIYFFRHGADFVRAAVDMIAVNERVNNEFYTCPVYNYAIRSGKRIGVYEIAKSDMHGIGTPEDLAVYLDGIR